MGGRKVQVITRYYRTPTDNFSWTESKEAPSAERNARKLEDRAKRLLKSIISIRLFYLLCWLAWSNPSKTLSATLPALSVSDAA